VPDTRLAWTAGKCYLLGQGYPATYNTGRSVKSRVLDPGVFVRLEEEITKKNWPMIEEKERANFF
jgi:hypothetical protein